VTKDQDERALEVLNGILSTANDTTNWGSDNVPSNTHDEQVARRGIKEALCRATAVAA
jgi:hypothetical protein